MKKIILTFALVLLTISDAQAKLFAFASGVTREEFIACNGKSDNPRCKGPIKMGCSALCKQSNNDPTLQKACQSLCQTTQPIVYKPEEENQGVESQQ